MTRLGAMGSERCHFHGRPVLASEAIPLSTRGPADAFPMPLAEKLSRGFAASADEAPPNRRAGGGGTADGFASLGMQWRVEAKGLVDSLIFGRRPRRRPRRR